MLVVAGIGLHAAAGPIGVDAVARDSSYLAAIGAYGPINILFILGCEANTYRKTGRTKGR
jgi:hypothetical protein